jgi:hypothetical protein
MRRLTKLTTIAMALALFVGVVGCGSGTRVGYTNLEPSDSQAAKECLANHDCPYPSSSRAEQARRTANNSDEGPCFASKLEPWNTTYGTACHESEVKWDKERVAERNERSTPQETQKEKEETVERLTGEPYMVTCRINGGCPEAEVEANERARGR